MQQEVRVEGVNETLRILRSFDKETLKAVNKEIYQEVKPLVGIARSMVPESAPMSGWAKAKGGEWGTRLAFNPQAVKMGIRTKIAPMRQRNSNTKERTMFLVQANPAGVVYEWAGRKTKGRPPHGEQFVRNIEERSGVTVIGKQSRIIWPIVYDNRKKIADNVARLVDRYVQMYNKKLAA